MDLLWKDSLFLRGESEIKDFFRTPRKRLFILAKGFDPRMCEGIKCLTY